MDDARGDWKATSQQLRKDFVQYRGAPRRPYTNATRTPDVRTWTERVAEARKGSEDPVTFAGQELAMGDGPFLR